MRDYVQPLLRRVPILEYGFSVAMGLAPRFPSLTLCCTKRCRRMLGFWDFGAYVAESVYLVARPVLCLSSLTVRFANRCRRGEGFGSFSLTLP